MERRRSLLPFNDGEETREGHRQVQDQRLALAWLFFSGLTRTTVLGVDVSRPAFKLVLVTGDDPVQSWFLKLPRPLADSSRRGTVRWSLQLKFHTGKNHGVLITLPAAAGDT